MPDDGEDGANELEELVDDALLTEVLMGWDGDPCECPVCVCPRFRDGGSDLICPECRDGRHWPTGGAST